MSESGLSLDEEVLSPDIFSDTENVITRNNPINSDESSTTSIGNSEPEPTDDVPEWKGMSMDQIRKGFGTYDCQELPPISPSLSHTVLISLPLPVRGTPKPYPINAVDKWCQGYVRMPHSAHSLYPIEQETASRRFRNRWEIIQESLVQSFFSSQQLEAAILSYNHIYAQRWDFVALHHFFSEVVDEEESKIFFEVLLPKIIQLALQLPMLVTGPLPLLKRHSNASISLSQLQVASLLANAFFCTFPRRNSTNPLSEYASYPHINFNRLFSAYREDKPGRRKSVMEKIKCFIHYFRRVTSKAPEGVITIQRRYVPKQECPKWDELDQKLLPLHITNKGTIETEGAGLLQVDFANKYVGGGVLGLGCVQEEIRFAICPELMVTMLVTEALDDTEALVVSGVEKYSQYRGYNINFKWTGDFIDETPRDSSGRRLTSIVAIDALYFKQPHLQFSMHNITRELNKAYVGFIGCESNRENLLPIATGNWGCGAFHGNPKLKVLLQLMAAAAAGRSMVYFTFGDTVLRDSIAEMYWHLVQHKIDIAHLYMMFSQYKESASKHYSDFYQFLYNKSKIKPLTKYFIKKEKPEETTPVNNINLKTESYRKHGSTPTESKSLQLCTKFYDNKQNFSKTKAQEEIHEERIQNWLANIDAKNGENNTEQKKKEISVVQNTTRSAECNVVYRSSIKNDHISDGDITEKKQKQSFWKILEQKATNRTTLENKLNSETLGTKSFVFDQMKDSANTVLARTQNSTTNPSELSNKCEITPSTKEDPTQLSKENLTSIKKNSQRKISDFFQRTS